MMGAETYMATRPCKHGNIAPRLMSGHCRCDPCRADMNEKAKQWQKKNAEKQRALVAKWQAANPEKVKASAAKCRKKRVEKERDYRRANRDSILARNQKRRGTKLSATPMWDAELDFLVFSEAAQLASLRKEATGKEWQLDHMIPLQARNVCGLHVGINIAVIPAALNLAKKNRICMTTPGSWLHGVQ